MTYSLTTHLLTVHTSLLAFYLSSLMTASCLKVYLAMTMSLSKGG